MATRGKGGTSAGGRKSAAAVNSAPRGSVGATDLAKERTAPPSQGDSALGPHGLLRSGLKALGTVRDDVVKHQANVIETLLGIGKGGFSAEVVAARNFPGLELRKFEDVFDHRVAAAMQRLGLPSALEIQALHDQVRELRERIEVLEGREKLPVRRRR